MVLLALPLLGLAGCYAHFSGAVIVDGAPFVPIDCRSGQAYGGMGVEVTDVMGRRLRIGANLDGRAGAALFQPGAFVGEELGACGPMTMSSQHSRVNGITNMMGTATLSCDSGRHQVSGQLSFENCH
jgi:hypothetical protein